MTDPAPHSETPPAAAVPSPEAKSPAGWGTLLPVLPALAAWGAWNLFLLVQALRG